MLRRGAALVLGIAVLVASSAANAQRRVALLIGNQGYSAEIGSLANPHNDIALLEKALRGLRFDVTSVRDASLGTMHQAINAYVRHVSEAGPDAVGFFYYAGHGASDGGTNYLIPVDARTVEQGILWDVSLRLTEITRKLKVEAGNAVHFVVFDACRNTLQLRAAGSRALVQSRGFVPVVQESGMLIAYATAEGELASDVGIYAKVLAEEIVKPGPEALAMFRNVQRRVRTAIKQEPYLGFNALGDVYFAGLGADVPKPVTVPAPPPPTPSLSEAAEAWDRTKDSTNIAVLEAFAARFKDTFYAELARARIAELSAKLKVVVEPPKVVVDPPKVAVEPPKVAEPPAAKKRETPEPPAKAATTPPKAEKQANVRQFDGAWIMNYKTGEGCPIPWSGSQPASINNGVITLQGGGGRITASGFASGNWVAPVTGTPLRYQAQFRGNSGAGTYVTKENCRGTFTVRRN